MIANDAPKHKKPEQNDDQGKDARDKLAKASIGNSTLHAMRAIGTPASGTRGATDLPHLQLVDGDYTVKKGDTIGRIAQNALDKKANVHDIYNFADKLGKDNKLQNVNHIFPGAKIHIFPAASFGLRPDANSGQPGADNQGAGQAAPGSNNGRPEGNTGKPSGNTGRPEGNAGRPEGNTGRPDGNTGRPDGNAGRPDGNTGRPDANNGKPDAPSANPEQQQGTGTQAEKKEPGLLGKAGAVAADVAAGALNEVVNHPGELLKDAAIGVGIAAAAALAAPEVAIAGAAVGAALGINQLYQHAGEWLHSANVVANAGNFSEAEQKAAHENLQSAGAGLTELAAGAAGGAAANIGLKAAAGSLASDTGLLNRGLKAFKGGAADNSENPTVQINTTPDQAGGSANGGNNLGGPSGNAAPNKLLEGPKPEAPKSLEGPKPEAPKLLEGPKSESPKLPDGQAPDASIKSLEGPKPNSLDKDTDRVANEPKPNSLNKDTDRVAKEPESKEKNNETNNGKEDQKGADASPRATVEDNGPNERYYSVGSGKYRLTREKPTDPWFYGKPPLEHANNYNPVKIHVNAQTPEDLEKIQKVLIPFLKENPEARRQAAAWKTFDPNATLNPDTYSGIRPEPTDQRAKAFTIWTKGDADLKALHKSIDEELTRNGLGLKTPPNTGNADIVYGNSNRVSLVRDNFEHAIDPSRKLILNEGEFNEKVRPFQGVKLDEKLAKRIEEKYGRGGVLGEEQLRQAEEYGQIAQGKLFYDKGGRLSLQHDLGNNDVAGTRAYLAEAGNNKTDGERDGRAALYKLAEKFGYNLVEGD